MPRLPIALPVNCNLSITGVGCCNGFQGIVSTAEGVLGDMRSRHRLACSTRSKTGRMILLRFAGGGMGGTGSFTYLTHYKHARADPCPACFEGTAWPVVLRIRLLE